MPGIIAPPESERKKWEEKQKRFMEAWKKQNEEDPPKNTAHKMGRTIWKILTFPQDPRTF